MDFNLLMTHPALFMVGVLGLFLVLTIVAYATYSIVNTEDNGEEPKRYNSSKRHISSIIGYGLLVFYTIGR